MPNARVGAMPQPSSQDRRGQSNQHGRGGMRQQSGITMEDLKKQTAMRLMAAQQQQQQRDRHVHMMSPQEGFHSSYPQGYENQWNGSGYNVNAHRSMGGAVVPSQLSQQPVSSYQSVRLTQSVSYSEQDGSEFYQANLNDDSSSTTSSSSAAVGVYPNGGRGTPSSRIVEVAPGPVPVPGPGPGPQPPQAAGPRYERRPLGQHRAAPELLPMQPPLTRPHHKLPHGLTVQELKEMTKARLAAEAEAAERTEVQMHLPLKQAHENQQGRPALPQHEHSQHVSNSSRTQQRYKQQPHKNSYNGTHPDAPGVMASCEITRQNSDSPSFAVTRDYNDPYQKRHSHNREKVLEGLQTNVQASPATKSPAHPWQAGMMQSSHESLPAKNVPNVYGGQDSFKRSPESDNVDGLVLPPQNQSIFSQGSFHQPAADCGPRPHRPSVDGLDSASVNSHNSTVASEYIAGSESPFRVGPNQSLSPYLSTGPNPKDNAGVFGRSRSYPSGPYMGNALESPSFETVVSPSSFSDARPVTSPLWSAHEDRPLMRTLTLPLFESNSLGAKVELDESSLYSREPTPTSERPRAYSTGMDSTDGATYLAKFVSSPFNTEGDAKTEETSSDRPLNPIPFNGASRVQSGHGDIPNWVAESVLVTPQRESRKTAAEKGSAPRNTKTQAEVGNKNAVFRNNNGGSAGRFGFSPSHGDNSVPDVSLIGEDRSGSWVEATPEPSVHRSVCSFGGLGSLPEDFGSALNLHSKSVPRGKQAPLHDLNAESSSPNYSSMGSILQESVGAQSRESSSAGPIGQHVNREHELAPSPPSSGFSIRNVFKSQKSDVFQLEVHGRKKKDSCTGS